MIIETSTIVSYVCVGQTTVGTEGVYLILFRSPRIASAMGKALARDEADKINLKNTEEVFSLSLNQFDAVSLLEGLRKALRETSKTPNELIGGGSHGE